ncbi:MAG: alpha/beta fold hydrolase [Thermoleophilia bacterium]|nr:alpha/beta fold hydrolase [Thermoleophilia bacterium]
MTSSEPPRKNSLTSRFGNMRRTPLAMEGSVVEVPAEPAASVTEPVETAGDADNDTSFDAALKPVAREPEPEPELVPVQEYAPEPVAVAGPEVAPELEVVAESEPTPEPEAAAPPEVATRRSRPSYQSTHSRFGGRRPLARTYDSSRRTGYMIIFVPIFALLLAITEIKLLVQRLSGRTGGSRTTPMHFERPPGMPPAAERSVADIVAMLEAYPFNPMPMSAHVAFNRQFGADSLSTAFLGEYSIATLHRYPEQFHQRLLRGSGGEPLAALVAMQPGPAPALIVCHGLMTTKNFDYIRRMAVRAYGWGFHVVTYDQRGWGDSAWTTSQPPSGGYYEGKDLIEIARELQLDEQVTSVGVLGYSMGAGAALNAARWASREDNSPIDGGVLAVSAPTKVQTAVEHISKRPHWRDPYFILYLVFGLTIRRNAKYFGASNRKDVRWITLVRELSLPHYRVTEEELYRRASAVNWADEIAIPTLELHAMDDFMVPVEHAFALRDAAEDNDNVHVMIVDKGNHVSFEGVDQRWYFSVVRRWFEYWAEEPADPTGD